MSNLDYSKQFKSWTLLDHGYVHDKETELFVFSEQMVIVSHANYSVFWLGVCAVSLLVTLLIALLMAPDMHYHCQKPLGETYEVVQKGELGFHIVGSSSQKQQSDIAFDDLGAVNEPAKTGSCQRITRYHHPILSLWNPVETLAISNIDLIVADLSYVGEDEDELYTLYMHPRKKYANDMTTDNALQLWAADNPEEIRALLQNGRAFLQDPQATSLSYRHTRLIYFVFFFWPPWVLYVLTLLYVCWKRIKPETGATLCVLDRQKGTCQIQRLDWYARPVKVTEFNLHDVDGIEGRMNSEGEWRTLYVDLDMGSSYELGNLPDEPQKSSTLLLEDLQDRIYDFLYES